MTRPRRSHTPWRSSLWRLLALTVIALVALQLYFLLRVAAMALIDPASTAFQRSEMWRQATQQGRIAWAQSWVPGDRIAETLRRAVVASEDAGFSEHTGVEWDAIERAWERHQPIAADGRGGAPRARVSPGGSTISQQLVKNLFLSGERTVLRKSQELLITLAMEAMLSKARILEIYLNHVEWGEGVYGAAMAARYYHRVDVSRLNRSQAARLAVMLPAPKRFEQRPNAPYLLGRASQVEARMASVSLP